MDKRLEKTLKEEIKLKEQLKALQDRINEVEEKREGFEKETLYKTFKETEISLEEYQMIVRSAVNDYKGLNDVQVKGEHLDEKDI
ncbi:hypothetical protein EZV73_15195 [Acidaminobacter sp. JC074]|uniref:hypothetical protein n=1 Tax=Acidaminobacter sp. JC074 TaxID=2530199 RepID=UPI001F0FDE19|nr:hypothetical protein [Acidaminobacter sp. JC074]MCH4888939.1 hypothetical protein [Acidaminobacter sp. JC074]